MALNQAGRKEIIEKFGGSTNNTGSAQVQIALITARLQYLNDHFKEHKRDFHSRRGLMKLVGQRRRLLDYLHRKDAPAYRQLIKELKIRK